MRKSNLTLYLLTVKFSKPKMSRTPMELVLTPVDFLTALFNLLTIQINKRP